MADLNRIRPGRGNQPPKEEPTIPGFAAVPGTDGAEARPPFQTRLPAEPERLVGAANSGSYASAPARTPKQKVEPEKITESGFLSTYLKIKERLDRYFVNETAVLNCGGKDFTINGLVGAGLLSKTSMYFIGSRGSGKTLLSEAIRRSVFGEEGFYLRGDPNMTIRDLFMRLNLHGKTEEEIYQLSRTIDYNFVLIDELNRVPGVLQNQFLFLLDGYIDVRGRTYPLGSGYLVAAATGNPPSNGEYTGVFDEDLALLDRLPLIINVDEIPHARGDIARIMEDDHEKSSIAIDDISPRIIACEKHLTDSMMGDPEHVAVLSLLSEYVYYSFRYVTIGNRELDKAQNENWREELTGEHSGGNMISYVSDISVRTLKRARRLGFALFKLAHAESETLRSKGYRTEGVDFVDLMDGFIDALKLSLTYDRRFIPSDLPRTVEKTHREVLEAAFKDLAESIDTEKFQDTSVLLMDFFHALRNGNEQEARSILEILSDSKEEHRIVELAHGIADAKLRGMELKKKEELIRDAVRE